jgi:hypothetical protein
MNMITHEEFINFSGNGERAISTALQTLLPLGFRIESQGSSHLIVSSHNYRSTKQDPLLGISRAEFSVSRFSLNVKAELGGVAWMRNFLTMLFVGLGVFDLIVFGALWYFLDALRPYPWLLAFPLASMLMQIFLGPIMTRTIKNRTLDALKKLLDNMAI